MSVKDDNSILFKDNSVKDFEKSLIVENENENKSHFPSFFSNFCNDIKIAFKALRKNEKCYYIIIGAFSLLILFLILLCVSLFSSSSSSLLSLPSFSFTSSSSYTEKTNKEFEIPNTSGICDKPYDIKVYTEEVLKNNLTNCGYKEGSQLFNFTLSAIKLHNLYRACHNAQPLIFNCEILEIAQNYSEHLAKDVGNLVVSNNRFHGEWMGENSAFFYGTNGEIPTKLWYSDYLRYNFSNPGLISGAGHFTLVVWKNSKEFGIGYSCDDNSRCFVVANYYPGGNFGNATNYKNNIQERQ